MSKIMFLFVGKGKELREQIKKAAAGQSKTA